MSAVRQAMSRCAWVPIPLLWVATAVLWGMGGQTVHESRLLLMLLNFVFSTLVSLLVVVLLGRSFLATGSPGVLLLGCGVAFWGAAGTVGPALLAHGGNVTISVHNLLVWLSGLCHLAGAALYLEPGRVVRRPGLVMALAYAMVVSLAWLVVSLVQEGWMPVFFVQGQGGTLARQVVLGSALMMFVAVPPVLWAGRRHAVPAFTRWYGLALLLVAAGLFGLMLQSAHGSALNWIARAAQLLGGAYMLVAAVVSLRESGGTAVNVLASLAETRAALHASEELNRLTLQALPAHIAVIDGQGRIVSVNEAWEEFARANGAAGSTAVAVGANYVAICRQAAERNDGEAAEAVAGIEAVLAGGQDRFTMEYACHGPDEPRWFLMTVVSFRAVGHGGAVITHLNITESKLAEREVERRRRREEILAGTAGRLLAAEDPQRVVNELCAEVMSFVECDVFFNFLVDDASGRLRLNAWAGIPREEAARIEWLDYGVAVCGCVAREGQRIIVEDIARANDPRTTLVAGYGVQAYCCHPLRSQGRVLGTLSFGTRGRTAFRPDEISMMAAVTELVAVAMQRLRDREALRENEQRLSLALDAAEQGVWETDLVTGKVTTSARFQTMYGVDASHTMETRADWRQFVLDEDLSVIDEKVSEAIRERRTFRAEFRVRRGTDDAVRWMHSEGQVRWDRDGRAIGLIGVIRDITESKRDEEERSRSSAELQAANAALRDSRRAAINLMDDAVAARRRAEEMSDRLQLREEQLRLFIEYAPAAIAMLDNDLRYVAASRRWLLDYRLGSEVVGKSHYELFPDIPERWKDVNRRCLAGEIMTAEEDHFDRADGTRQWIRWEVHPWRTAPNIIGGIIIFSEDITARKLNEEAVIRAKQEWERTFDSVPDLIAILDERHRVIRTNRAMAAKLGCTPAACVGVTCFRAVHGCEAPPENCPHAQTMQDGQEHSAEVHEERLGGDFLVTTTPLKDAEGHLIGAVHVARDITERKQRERQLQRLNRALNALSHSGQSLVRAHREGDLYNEACHIIARDCGYAMVWIGVAEDNEARAIRPVAYAGFEDGYLERLKLTWADTERGQGPTGTAVRTGQVCQCRDMLTDPRFLPWREEALRRGYASSIALPLLADGRTFGALTIYAREPDGFAEDEVKLLADLAADIALGVASLRARAATERAEQAVHESEARYRSLFTNMTDGFALHEIITDDEGRPCDYRFLDLNPCFERLTGLRRGDLVGRRVTEVLPATERSWIETYGRVALTGEPAHIESFSGELGRWYEVFAYRPAPRQFAVIFMDVTARKEAERKLRETAQELFRSNKDLEQFAYVSSHDLKEPLRMVTGFLSLLKARYQGKLDAKAEEYIAFASDGATRMQQLVDDLLAYSRVGRSSALETVDVGPVIEQALRNLSVMRDEAKAVVIQEAMPTVKAHASELTQVFQNLIGNAIKFRKPGVVPEVRVSAARVDRLTEPAAAGTRGQEPGAEHAGPSGWLFTVQDNGIGIDPECRARVFEIFQRLHSTAQYPGTGIGLALCKKIVETHGGCIWVESEPGTGSAFRFTLPG